MGVKPDIFHTLVRRMRWLEQQQGVLAQNIANADTPDVRPQDLKHGPSARILSRVFAAVQPAATHPSHPQDREIRRNGSVASANRRLVFETAPAGNAVAIDERLMKVAETRTDDQTLTNVYGKHVQMVRATLDSGEA